MQSLFQKLVSPFASQASPSKSEIALDEQEEEDDLQNERKIEDWIAAPKSPDALQVTKSFSTPLKLRTVDEIQPGSSDFGVHGSGKRFKQEVITLQQAVIVSPPSGSYHRRAAPVATTPLTSTTSSSSMAILSARRTGPRSFKLRNSTPPIFSVASSSSAYLRPSGFSQLSDSHTPRSAMEEREGFYHEGAVNYQVSDYRVDSSESKNGSGGGGQRRYSPRPSFKPPLEPVKFNLTLEADGYAAGNRNNQSVDFSVADDPPITESDHHQSSSQNTTEGVESNAPECVWGAYDPLYYQVCSQVIPRELASANMFFGLDKQRAELAAILRVAHHRSEFASVLLLGAKGTGKQHCFEGALKDISPLKYHVVQLDGSILLTDKIAAREISRQLCLSNHAQLRASLEALADEEDDGEKVVSARGVGSINNPQGGSFSDHLRFLIKVLKREMGVRNDRLLFFLRNFDKFAKRPKQTLLYSLLDLAHASDTKFVIVASSEVADCMTTLDKRVRSRFDNVTFHFPAKPYSTDELCELFRSRLHLDEHRVWNKSIDDGLTAFRPTLDAMVLIGDDTVGTVLRKVFMVWLADIQFSFRTFFRASMAKPADFSSVCQLNLQDAQGALARCLTREEMVLILSALYIERFLGKDNYTFAAIHEHSTKIRKGPPDANVDEKLYLEFVSREVSLLDFESLLSRRYFEFIGNRRKNVPKEYQPVRLTFIDVDDGLLKFMEKPTRALPLPMISWAKKLRNS